jgi:hypothetical protein
MPLPLDRLEVTSFATTEAAAPAQPVTDEAECWSPKCGPTAAPVVCPDTGTVA